MHSEILSKYSFWYILPILLFSGFISWYLYRKDDKFSTIETWKLYVMMTLRFLSVFIIGLFLLSVVIRYTHIKIERPVILLAQDNSESIKLSYTNTSDKDKYISALDSLKDILSEKYEIKTLSFGEKIMDSINFTFDEKETDFSELFSTLEKKIP